MKDKILKFIQGPNPDISFWCRWGFHKWKQVEVHFYSNYTHGYVYECDRPGCTVQLFH